MSFDPTAPFVGLVELSQAYATGQAKPSDVVRAHLERIAAQDPKLGAFQAVYAKEATLCAEAADRMFDAGHCLGPFHGIPFGLKDICDLEGRITTGGAQALASRVSPQTGTVAQRLLAAGGILLGKTKTVECAFGGWGTNQHMGTPWNPWVLDVHHVPGGSSSGTGVSTAAGLAVCGVGTDTGGSVRLPAAFCGLVGLKVTEGRLPTDGILPLSQTLDTPGPLARSAIDAWVMFLVMDGQSGAAIARDLAQKSGAFGALHQGVAGLRLGVLDDGERALCAPEIAHSYEEAIRVLEGLGAQLVPFQTGASNADLTQTCGRIIATEAYFNHRNLYDQADLPLDEDVRARMIEGRETSAADYLDLLAERQRACQAFLTTAAEVDAILTPTALKTAPALSDVDQAEAPGHFTRFVNYLGLCALSLPIGLSDAGLPISLQVVACPHDEAMAMRIGAAFEAARGPFPNPYSILRNT